MRMPAVEAVASEIVLPCCICCQDHCHWSEGGCPGFWVREGGGW